MPGGPDSDRMVRHGLLLLLANAVVAGCNLGFQLLAARTLSDPEYAILVAFLEAVALLAVPTAGLSTALTHYTVRLHADHGPAAVWGLARRWCLRTTLAAGVVVLLAVVGRGPLADMLRFDRHSAVVAAGLALAATLMLPVWSAVLAGLQRFGFLSAYMVTLAGSRVVLAWGCMMLFYPGPVTRCWAMQARIFWAW